MSDFKERLKVEKSGIDEKIEKLEAFISSEKYENIEAVQKSLLNIQIQAMHTYSQCLLERLVWLDIQVLEENWPK